MLLAADGQHALEVAAAHEGDIHLLLTDVVMPGGDVMMSFTFGPEANNRMVAGVRWLAGRLGKL